MLQFNWRTVKTGYIELYISFVLILIAFIVILFLAFFFFNVGRRLRIIASIGRPARNRVGAQKMQ
jgi:hypothetical protein